MATPQNDSIFVNSHQYSIALSVKIVKVYQKTQSQKKIIYKKLNRLLTTVTWKDIFHENDL